MTDISSEVAPQIPKATSPNDRFSRWMLGISLMVVAGVFLTYLLLALPANDDFGRSTQPRMDQGIWGFGYWAYFCRLYMRWQGRWASFGLEAAVLPIRDMTKVYPALIGAVAAVNFAGVYCLCRCVTRLGSRWFSLACGIGLSALLWAEMPSVAQAVYWFVGVVENTMVLALAGMLLAGLVTFRATIPWMMIASLLAIFTCGFHEAYGAMLCIALAAGTLAAYWMKSENRLAWLVVLIAAVIGLGIVAGAPGNRNRLRTDGNIHSRHFIYDLELAITQFTSWSREWLFDPKLIAASLWVAFSPTLEASRPLWPNVRKVPWRLLLPLAWLAMLAVGFFAPSWAFGTVMPKRTLSGNFMVFATGWLIIVFVWTRRLDARDQASLGTNGLRGPGASAMAKLVLALALMLTGNTMNGLSDLATRRALRWRSSVEARYALLRHSGNLDLVIPRQAPPCRLLYDNEITTDPTYWANTGIAEFFHVKSVRVPPTPSTLPSKGISPVPDSELKTPNM